MTEVFLLEVYEKKGKKNYSFRFSDRVNDMLIQLVMLENIKLNNIANRYGFNRKEFNRTTLLEFLIKEKYEQYNENDGYEDF